MKLDFHNLDEYMFTTDYNDLDFLISNLNNFYMILSN